MDGVKLRQAFESGQSIVAPGVFDMISAVITEKLGFEAIYIGGYGISASHLGAPDVGIMTFTDIYNRVRMISEGSTKPIIVDADTGYGGLINLRHAVRSFEKLGVAAIQIEDQEFPKRCGHSQGVKVITIDEMVKRIGVACESRKKDDMLIIARTDCRTELGLNEAIRRAKAYSSAGADLIFIESPKSINEMEMIIESIEKPLVFKMVPDGELSDLDTKTLSLMGFSLIIYPSLGFLSAANAMNCAYNELKNIGRVKNQPMQEFNDFSQMIGFDEIYSFEGRWQD